MESRIVITPAGEQADPFLLELANRQNAAVISNDKYSDLRSSYAHVIDGRLLNFEVVGADVLVPKLNL